MIRVDGSQMEGGGQLLRMATSYAGILCESVNVYNIRGKRRNPGLRPQHLATLKTASELCGGTLSGLELGSSEIVFHPKQITGGEYTVDIGTAGSISLMLQCLTPISFYALDTVQVSIRGGTCVKWAPSTPFLKNVVYPAYRSMGASIQLAHINHGFYPKGGGNINLTSTPIEELSPFKPSTINLKKVKGVSITGNLPRHIAERQANSARELLNNAGLHTDITIMEVSTLSPGSVICLWVDEPHTYLGADSLGARGLPAEKVGAKAATSLISQLNTGANIDKHTCDHLILPCSLAKGVSTFKVSELTLHTLTAIKLATTFTGAEIMVDGLKGKPATITVKGIQWST